MNLEEIKELLRAVGDTDVTEFEYESGGDRVRIRRGGDSAEAGRQQPPYIVVTSALPGGAQAPPADPALASPPPPLAPPAPPPPADDNDGLVVVSSPIVGTFYDSPSPGAAAFVQVGDRVEAGQTLCIIEAMKLMNEIEAEVGGVVVKRFVKNTQPVEYGEPLFGIRPN